MKWAYSIQHKTTASILLAIVLALVMLNNMVERNQIKRLDKSVSSMYEDRLLAESYLFQLYERLHQKNDFFEASVYRGQSLGKEFDFEQLNQEIKEIVEKYEKTWLTPKETTIFKRFKAVLSTMFTIDTEILRGPEKEIEQASLFKNSASATDEAFVLLSELSKIQTVEGSIIRSQSKKILLVNISSSQFEMAILVIIALLIQILVFASKSLQLPKPANRSHLN